jgi:hypothetical protein
VTRHCEEQRDEAIHFSASPDGDVFVVPDDHRMAVLEGLEQAKRAEFVSDEEMAELWKRCVL